MLITIFYILSFIGAYNFVRVAYSRNGRWSSLTPNGLDMFMVFVAPLNTILAILWIFGFAKKNACNLTKFFRIKD